MPYTIELNAPTEGDDPENRYDCDDCLHAPQPTELICLLRDDAGHITQKYCTDCVTAHLPTN